MFGFLLMNSIEVETKSGMEWKEISLSLFGLSVMEWSCILFHCLGSGYNSKICSFTEI